MKVLWSFEMLVTLYQFPWHNILKDLNLQLQIMLLFLSPSLLMMGEGLHHGNREYAAVFLGLSEP
jgi:hypothetical protein